MRERQPDFLHLVAVSGVRLEERLPVRVPQFHRLVLPARHAVVAVDVVTDRSHGALASISTFPLWYYDIAF